MSSIFATKLGAIKFWSKSLMARLVSYFLLLLLLTVGLVGTIAFFQAREALKASVFERLDIAATLKEDEINRWIEDQRQQLLFLAQSAEVRTHAAVLMGAEPTSTEYERAYTALSTHLMTLLSYESDLREIFLLTDIGGRIVFSTDPANEGQYRVSDHYFTQGRLEPFVQTVYPSPLTGESTLTIAAPLLDQAGQRLGVLAIHLNLERLDQIIRERTGLGQSGQTYVVDKVNRFVSQRQGEMSVFPRGVHSVGIDAAVHEQEGQDLYLNYAGVPVIGIYRWINSLELALIAEIDQDEAFAPAHNLAWTIFLVGLLAAGVLAVVVYLAARQIARPILAIADTALQVAAGDLTRTAPVLTNDEIGLLARTFNQMTRELRSLYEALRRSEEHFRSLIENASDMITVLDADGTIRYESPSIERLFGYEPSGLIGSNAFEFIHPEDIQQALNVLPHNGPPGHPQTVEFRFRHQDGSWRILESISKNLLNDPSVAGVVVNSRDITQRKQRERELEVIAIMSMALRTAPTRAEMLPIVLDQLLDLLGAAGTAVALYDPATREARIELARGIWEKWSGETQPSGTSVSEQVMLTGQPYLRNNVQPSPHAPELEELAAVVCVPLIAREQTIGALWMGRRTPITHEELRLLTAVADIAANAIHRATLHDQLEESYIETVFALAKAMDARDDYTGDHSLRLAQWAEATARALGLSESEVETARWGALLHDIGKIGVPDGILRKPGRLTEEEYHIMKRHPEIGADIIAPVKRLAKVAPVVRAHHERYDGKGYPDGLVGEQIPLPARILTVADSYSAMTDDRVYRRGLSHEEAAAELHKGAGTQFDPRVVEAFLAILARVDERHA